MKNPIKKMFFFISCILNLFSNSQNIDSLKNVLKKAKHDTLRMSMNILMGKALYPIQIDSSLRFFKDASGLAEKNLAKQAIKNDLKIIYKNKFAYSEVWIGYIFVHKNMLNEGIGHYEKSLKLYEGTEDKKGLSKCLSYAATAFNMENNINQAISYLKRSIKIDEDIGDKLNAGLSACRLAIIYSDHGQLKEALNYLHFSLQLLEKINNKSGISNALSNIAFIYNTQGQTNTALDYLKRSLKIQKEIGDTIKIAHSLTNIGIIYNDKKLFKEALEYFESSLKILEQTNDIEGIAATLNNIGSIHKAKNELDEAMAAFRKSLKLSEKINNKQLILVSLFNIASVMFDQSKINDALDYATRSMAFAREMGLPDRIAESAHLLKDIYQKKNKSKEALKMFEIYIQMRDSIYNEDIHRASVKKEFQYAYEKKAAADSVRAADEQKINLAKLSVSNAKLKEEATQRYALYGGLGVVMLFSGFMVNRFRITRKQKKIIEHQKKIVDEKQKEILDSIYYARRIQQSLLPTDKYIIKTINRLNKN
jgi:tetratricopeptide (TPR) repeat protein